MAAEVKVTPGTLPPFWNRGVVFFSNMRSVFYDNKAETDELISQIYGAHSYGSRVVPILNLLFRRGPNHILLETPPEPHLLEYFYTDLALSLPTFAVLDHSAFQRLVADLDNEHAFDTDASMTMLRQHPAEWLDGFVTDRALVRISTRLKKRTINSLAASKNGNNKYMLYLHQREQHLPVFDTFMAADPGDVRACLERLRSAGYCNAVIKAQIGASGYGMIKLKTDVRPAPAVPEYLFFEGPAMVQGWLDQAVGAEPIGSPSIQMFLTDDAIYLFDSTEQILSKGSVHEGNVSPPPYLARYDGLEQELYRQGAIAGQWLHGQGYRGAAGTDFLVGKRSGRVQVVICEINARVTGATYPSILARYFVPACCWHMRNIAFRGPLNGGDILSRMNAIELLYHPGSERGILPFNFNIDAHGTPIKGQFLAIGRDHEDCEALLAGIARAVPVSNDHDG